MNFDGFSVGIGVKKYEKSAESSDLQVIPKKRQPTMKFRGLGCIR